MPDQTHTLLLPKSRTTSVVFGSPHSCSIYPGDLMARSVLSKQAIRSSEDAFIDRLFDCAPDMGAPLLLGGAPRAYVDLNRNADELDPALIEAAPRGGHNPRVASGLGVIPRVVANGQAIYSGKLTMGEVHLRLARYWHPYHRALKQQMHEAHARFGQAILIDCHSMPHEAARSVTRSGHECPDVVLGDRFGTAASADVVDRVEAAFASAGLNVLRNTPFAGAYITQTYGRPSLGNHAIQVEIDRALYMDECRIVPNARFEAFREMLAGIISEIVAIGRPLESALAAE